MRKRTNEKVTKKNRTNKKATMKRAKTEKSRDTKEKEMKSITSQFNQINYRVIGELGRLRKKFSAERLVEEMRDERGDVPGWVLVVLMTTGLVTAIWTIAAPRLQQILKNSLDSMSNIR